MNVFEKLMAHVTAECDDCKTVNDASSALRDKWSFLYSVCRRHDKRDLHACHHNVNNRPIVTKNRRLRRWR